jgi:pimeloyl-ACP methyl ester carboxylesterase
MHQRERRLAINGVEYHVDEYGEGRPVLLLHGMPDTAAVWHKQIPHLVDAGFRVIAPDMLGYGRTGKPAEASRYALENVVTDLLAIIDALQLERTDIVGHDWGGLASWSLTSLAPNLFRRHVAIQVGHPAAFVEDVSPTAMKENWYMYLNAMPGAEALYRAADFAYPRQVLATHPHAEEVIKRLRDPVALRSHLNWDAGNPMTLMYADGLDGKEALPKCAVPTMGIWSQGDVFLWEEQVANSHRFMAAPWRYVRLDSGSHWVMLDNAPPVTASILEWLTADEIGR